MPASNTTWKRKSCVSSRKSNALQTSVIASVPVSAGLIHLGRREYRAAESQYPRGVVLELIGLADRAAHWRAEAQRRLGMSHDYIEGVSAFFAKRAPVFKDR